MELPRYAMMCDETLNNSGHPIILVATIPGNHHSCQLPTLPLLPIFVYVIQSCLCIGRKVAGATM